jgi:hypothetical protein
LRRTAPQDKAPGGVRYLSREAIAATGACSAQPDLTVWVELRV